MPRRLPLAILGFALLAAACSSPSGTPAVIADPEPTVVPSPTTPNVPDDNEPSPGDDPLDDSDDGQTSRIAIQTADESLVTVLPDGSDVQPLGDDTKLNTRPTWSHDASFVAWASTDPDTGATAVAASRFDGSGAHRAATVGPATAIGWDPTSTVVSYLAGVPTGQQLSVVGVVDPTPEQPVDSGSPYWYTWAPDDQEFLVNADGFRVDRIDLDGSTVELSTESGSFQTPVWNDTERALLFAAASDDGNILISTGDEGQGRLPLLTYDGYLRLVANPDANRLAVHVDDRPPDVAEIITAAFQPDPESTVALERGRLYVMTVFGGSPVAVDRLPAEAFQWDPQGATLAYLVRLSDGDDPWYEWRFFGPNGVTTGPLHQLSDTFRDEYLPFFDQLAGDVTFFSPDGTQFVFTGRPLGAETGVWVHTIGDDTEPTRIADGSFATWSPGPAGGAARSVL